AYALLARERGYATRVVVGYLLPPPDAGGGFTVTEAQAHAWPEVALEGLGWVAVEPTDLSRIGQTDAEADDVPEVPPDAPGEEGEQIDATEPRVVVDESGEPTGGGARVVRRGLAVGGIALVAGVLSLPLVAALVKAGRRRRRRTAPSTAAQVVGAWQETVDRLTGQGVQVDAAHTPPEVVAGVAARFDGALGSLHPLAALVSLAIYGPDEPPGEAAARAWALERSARGELAAVTGRPRQALAWVDPRPLLPTGRR
ncbi:MAG TPA: transglutaminase domain-containing protein, partial [Acidimicrobiales bacterium]|nr:transglutaminase domain-containing protein [Acidimicrobiales bacterium]